MVSQKRFAFEAMVLTPNLVARVHKVNQLAKTTSLIPMLRVMVISLYIRVHCAFGCALKIF